LRRDRTVLAAPDSFKGTCAATEVAEAIAAGARSAGWDCDRCPVSDGGEGFGAVLAAHASPGHGSWRTTTVTGPLGTPVAARWWFAPSEAVIESAAASGLVLAGGSAGNDPLAATSRGTGELIAEALRAGARRVLVGVGGSASTDGGLGALEVLEKTGGLGGAEVLVACDVETSFVDAAAQFGPQKGASPTQVEQLRDRLVVLADRYRERFGVDVTSMSRSGAAGGLAGGLAALGARLVGGFELVAGAVDLDRRIAAAGIVVSGEGRLDSSSWSGKVVGGVLRRALSVGVPVLVVVGELGPGGLPVPAGSSGSDTHTANGPGGQAARHAESRVQVVSLAARFGDDQANAQPALCVKQVVREHLEGR